MRRHLFLLIAFASAALFVAACAAETGSGNTPTPTEGVENTEVADVVVAEPTATATETPLATATVTLTPTATNTATATPTPQPILQQLTTNGCCVQPRFSPNGDEIWYLDQPDPDVSAALYGISIETGEGRLVNDRLGIYSPNGNLLAYPERERTYIQRLSDGEVWEINNGGRQISFSPDGTRTLWVISDSQFNFDSRRTDVYLADLNGNGGSVAVTLIGGRVLSWLPDASGLLVTNRDVPGGDAYLARYDFESEEFIQLGDAERLRGVRLSPNGEWMTFMISMTENPADNGLWLMRIDGSERRKLPLRGGFQWRTDTELLSIPADFDAPAHYLELYNIETEELRKLTDPNAQPFRVEGGDWQVSRDGQQVVFVSAEDRNIWLIELP